MAFVSGAIPNLIGGVSQQPADIRALNCSTALLNTWSDVITGLSTRPSGAYLGKIGVKPVDGSTVATHVINKASGDYHVSIYDGTVKVVKLTDGVPEAQTITVEDDADAYISGVTDAAAAFGFVTVGDTTFIYNRSKVVEAIAGPEGAGGVLDGRTDDGVVRKNPNRFGTLWVKQRAAGWNRYYGYYNGVKVGEVNTDVQSASEIASGIRSGYVSAGRSATIIGGTGSVISIQLNAEGDYITAKDDFGDQATTGYNDEVEEFTDLPNVDIEGRLVLIKGSVEDQGDDYWVWYKKGRWQETYGWNSYEKPDNSTMPVILVHNPTLDTWTLKYTNYPGREVGDTDSNPSPTFIGRTIRSMFLYKGRMVILSDENFVASRISNFENFYRQTCTQLLDDDPIDIASSNSRGATLNFGREFDGDLMLFSAFDQFRLSADSEGLLSPNTVSIKRVNSYNNSMVVEPGYIGPNIAFVDDFGTTGFAALREYQTERVYGTQVALPITDAVPEYIPSGVYKLIYSSTYNNLVVASKGDRKKLWLYNYYFNSEGKVISAWQAWSYTGTIFGIDYSRDQMLVTVAYDGELHILQHVFDSGADTLLDKKSILLDYGLNESQVTRTAVGSGTQIELPFDIDPADEDTVVLVVSPSSPGAAVAAQTYKPSSILGGVVTFPNVDLTGPCEFVIGMRYQFRWKPSPVYMRDRNQVAIQDGRLQLRRMSFLYNHSGPFRTEFTPKARQTYTSTFTGFIVGAAGDTLGNLSLDSGEFKVSVNGPGELMDLWVTAWTPWRVRFSTLEWEGSYRPKKRRT